MATIYYKNGDDLLSDNEKTVKPLGVILIVPVDSGSQVTCVSQQFFGKLMEVNPNIPRLPINCVTLTSVFGKRDCKVKEQAYLTIRFETF